MEENHHHQEQQQRQQPKFSNNNGYHSFNSQQYYQVLHHSPFAFQQNFPAVPTPVQGFSQFAHTGHNSSTNQHPFQLVSLQPQRRPIHQDQENLSSSNRPYITPSPAVLPFSLDLDGKNAGACYSGGAGVCGGGGGALDTRKWEGGSHYGGWQNQEDSAAITVRQPLRKPFPDNNGNDKWGNDIKDKEMPQQPSDQLNGNKLFGELQELCRAAATSDAAAVAANKANTNRDDGGLVENFAAVTTTTAPCLPPTNTNEDTNGDELPSRMADADDEEKKQKKIDDDEMSSVAVFFERFVYRLMEHQENLYKKFMAAIEKVDQEWKEREQVWRQKELERLDQEAALRANERAVASQREASIVAYLEKITGESFQLPSNLTVNELSSRGSRGCADDSGSLKLMKNRWPPVEVDALIQLRMSLEKKFQGPGYKGPLWDEISKLMASLGYHRTAKRCKEKWENINKYFKKYKESSSSNSKFKKKMNKTCRYFDQLDQLYSKSSGLVINGGSNSCSSSSEDHQGQGNNPFSSKGSGLLIKQNEAFVSPRNLIEAAGPITEELKQGSIIQRIDEGQHPMSYCVEDMEVEREEVENGHGNVNDEDAAA